MAAEVFERVVSNCFACGKSMEQIRDMPRHNPTPTSEADRCLSRPGKYADLQCMYAIGHECEHTGMVKGTGLHYWSDQTPG
jgi:hypothetical protein